MIISAIVAMSENRVIGINNQLPWHLPADFQYFKKITMGKPIIMGRKTFESIGKVLPGRLNIIVTRDQNYHAENARVTHSLQDALSLADQNEMMVIGGAQLFKEALPKIHRLYLTLVHAHIEGDSFFPEINSQDWKEISREDHVKDEKNRYDYSFIVLEKIRTNSARHPP